MESKYPRSDCPLSKALDILGDKWSLLIIRDMFMNKKKYCDFQASPEKIPTNILADRLRRLEINELIAKQPYQIKPLRYEYFLTSKGAHLLPVLQQLIIWAQNFRTENNYPPVDFLTAKPEDFIKND